MQRGVGVRFPAPLLDRTLKLVAELSFCFLSGILGDENCVQATMFFVVKLVSRLFIVCTIIQIAFDLAEKVFLCKYAVA